MKVLEKISGSFSSEVELVEIDGENYVLKSFKESRDVVSEKMFYDVLEKNNIPVLGYYENSDLKENQMLLEYVDDSMNLAKVFDVKNCRKWGKLTRRMHDIGFPDCFRYEDNAKKEMIAWTDVMRNQVVRAFSKAEENDNYGYSQSELIKIREYVDPLLKEVPERYSLIHGDLHTGNVLVRGDELVLIDKNSNSFSGDRLLDLAIAWVDMPNDSLLNTDDPENTRDRNCLGGFSQGYGEIFLENNRVKSYVMLITFGRLYTPFSKHYKNIIMNLLEE